MTMKTTRASASPTAGSQTERAIQYVFEPYLSSMVAAPEVGRPLQVLEDAREDHSPRICSRQAASLLDGANDLTLGQIYLREHSLLRTPLALDDIKRRLLGHWSTSAGLNFIYGVEPMMSP